MKSYKNKVLEMIDAALRLNSSTSGCTCVFNDPTGHLCAHCSIRDTLRTARGCIVESTGRLEGIEKKMVKIQEDAVSDLKALLAHLD